MALKNIKKALMKKFKSYTFNSFKYFSVSFILLFLAFISKGQQYNEHVCFQKGVSCNGLDERNGIIYSFEEEIFEYSAVGTSMPFWLAVGDVSIRSIDTTFKGTISASLISGPGSLKGTVASNIWKYCYFNDWTFSSSGDYKIQISVSGYVTDTIKIRVPEKFEFCSAVPKGCGSVKGNAVFPLSGNGGIIPVDAIFPITIGVYDRLTGLLDSNFQNYAYVDKISGPGNIYGTLSMYGSGWLTFTDVRFDQIGIYDVKLRTEGFVIPDTVTIHVVESNSVRDIGFNKIKVYPNPSSDVVNITGNNEEILSAVRIYSMQGKAVKKLENLNLPFVKIPDLPVGVYFLEVNLNGSDELQKGIIIKH